MGLLRTAATVSVATSVHGRVRQRQNAQWAAANQSAPQQPATPQPVPGVQPAPAVEAAPDDLFDQLRQLGELRDSGILSEDEFTTQKARILAK
jgi:hypothetical protein